MNGRSNKLQIIHVLSQQSYSLRLMFHYWSSTRLLVDKEHLPNWNPKFLKDATDEMVGKFFCSLGKNEWKVKQAANNTRLESAKL